MVDGRTTTNDIAPVKQSGKQRKADTRRVIHAFGFDTALDIPRKLFAKNQILSANRAGRAQERDDQPQDVKATPTIVRANCNMG